MPWTIWRYALLELWRLVLLSTAVLVGVIAFAVTIKPLADGDLDPLSALRFMAMAMPPMLAYALPFAAAFGATLAYHRMAQDNEVVAAQAGGISHRRLLAPALASGIALAAFLGVLNDQVIPRFLAQMERMVTRDLAQIFVRQIERGDAAAIDNLSVYADAVRDFGPDPDTGAIERLLLTGVVAIELDDEGRVVTDATTERATVELVRGRAAGFEDAGLAAVITLYNGFAVQRGNRYAIETLPLDPIPVPDAFEDNPKYLTGGGLRELRARPERMSFIESRRWDLARTLATTESVDALRRALEAGAPAVLEGPGGQRIEIRAAGLAPVEGGWALTPPAGSPVEIERLRDSNAGRDLEFLAADAAFLRPSTVVADPLAPGAERARVSFDLELEGVSTRRADGSPVGGGRVGRTLRELTLRGDPMRTYARASAAELLAAAAADAEPVWSRADNLAKRLARLDREITAKQHERVAMAVTCLLMVITGAVTALRLRTSMPLVVYLWSFLPAIGTLLLISAGTQSAERDGLAAGLALLWSGPGVLAVYAAVMLADLSRR